MVGTLATRQGVRGSTSMLASNRYRVYAYLLRDLDDRLARLAIASSRANLVPREVPFLYRGSSNLVSR